MLKLTNIKRNENVIMANYEPEGSGLIGYVSVYVNTGEIVELKKTKCDEDTSGYIFHAVRALNKIANQKVLPDEKLVMWY